MTVTAIHDHGGPLSEVRSVFASLEEATAQVVHDVRMGQGIPLRIVDPRGKILLSGEEIQALALVEDA